MYIMTKRGYRPVYMEKVIQPGKTPTLLEQMGVSPHHDGVEEMRRYVNSRMVYGEV